MDASFREAASLPDNVSDVCLAHQAPYSDTSALQNRLTKFNLIPGTPTRKWCAMYSQTTAHESGTLRELVFSPGSDHAWSSIFFPRSRVVRVLRWAGEREGREANLTLLRGLWTTWHIVSCKKWKIPLLPRLLDPLARASKPSMSQEERGERSTPVTTVRWQHAFHEIDRKDRY